MRNWHELELSSRDGGVRTIVTLGLAGTFEDSHGDVMLGCSLEGLSGVTGYRNGCVVCAGYRYGRMWLLR